MNFRALKTGYDLKVIDGVTVKVLEYNAEGNILRAEGETVPSSLSGFAVGARFVQTDGSAGSIDYVNEGTVLSCTFNAVRSGGTEIGLSSLSTDAKTFTVSVNLATITTTGNTDGHILIGRAGTLAAVYFNGTDALAANDTNYLTFTLRNLKADGSGSDEMLFTGDASTTKATGGSALSAVTTRSLQISGSALNLAVSAQHRLRFRAAASGTLANTITNGVVTLVFTAA